MPQNKSTFAALAVCLRCSNLGTACEDVVRIQLILLCPEAAKIQFTVKCEDQPLFTVTC